MRLWSILGNSQKLDGGAMFGNVPRAMWEKWIQPDEQHRIPLASSSPGSSGMKLARSRGCGLRARSQQSRLTR